MLFFVVSGSGQSNGKILQRFPEEDWDSCPFTPGIELVSNVQSNTDVLVSILKH